MDANTIIAVSAAVSAIATAVIGYFSWRTVEMARANLEVARANLEVAEKLAWFTGSMESHSDLQSRFAAKSAGVEVVWWDPTLEPVPHTPRHKEKAELNTMYVYLPPELRASKKKAARTLPDLEGAHQGQG